MVKRRNQGPKLRNQTVKNVRGILPARFAKLGFPRPRSNECFVNLFSVVSFAKYLGMDTYNCWPLVSAQAFLRVKHLPTMTSSAVSFLSAKQLGTQSLG